MIVVLIPAYDQAATLPPLLAALPDRLHDRLVVPIVVSDGSTDDTAAVARDGGVEVVELPTNRGKTAAVRTGLELLERRPLDCVVLMDGDGQHDPRDLAALTWPVLSGELDVACGSRWLGQRGRGHAPLNRYLVRQAVIRVLHRRLGQRITDPFCGYRCLSSPVVSSWRPSRDRYEAELELLFDAVLNGWTTGEVAVARIYTGECSKMRATEGRVAGRLRVVRQYARTISRKSQELALHAPPPTDSRPARTE